MKPNRRVVLIVLIAALLIAGSTAAWQFRPDTKSLPDIAATTALPTDGTRVAIPEQDGNAWLEFTTEFKSLGETPRRPVLVYGAIYSVLIKYLGDEAVDIEVNDDLQLIDSVGLVRRANLIGPDGEFAVDDDFELQPGESRTFEIEYGLPVTVEPATLIWNQVDFDRSTVAILHSWSGVLGTVGQAIPTVSYPGDSSQSGNRWLMLPAGVTNIEDVQVNALTHGGGMKFWEERRQFGTVTYSFTNQQSGPFHWFADQVIAVDQTGTAITRFTEGRTDSPESLDSPRDESDLTPYSVDAGETYRQTVGFEVTPGTEIRLVMLVGSRSITLVSTGAAPGNVAAPVDLAFAAATLNASGSCGPYEEWSARTWETVDLLNEVLAFPYEELPVDLVPHLEDYVAQIQARIPIQRDGDTDAQADFSESRWMLGLMDQTSGWVSDTAEFRASHPNDPPMMLKSSTWNDLTNYLGQFETRLNAMDNVFMEACPLPIATPAE